MDELVNSARTLWTELAGAPVTFHPGGVGVAVSGSSRLCPPGWIGLVVIADAGIATVPTSSYLEAVAELPASRATDPTSLTDSRVADSLSYAGQAAPPFPVAEVRVRPLSPT